MSEDDNTNGADDSAYSSNVMNSDELHIAVPTSTSCSDVCHSITNLSENLTIMSSPIHSQSLNTSPQSTNFVGDIIHSSLNGINLSLNNSSGISTSSEANKINECSFETAVSSTNMLEDERSLHQQTPESDVVSSLSISPQSPEQPTDLSIHSNVIFTTSQEKSIPTKSIEPDISGLELLSNSIEAFEKRPFIKQEPIERIAQISPNIYEPPVTVYLAQNANAVDEIRRSRTEQFESRNNSFDEHISPTQTPHAKASNFGDEQLGGLNLLCALAEQHFQEEVDNEQRLERKRSLSSDGSESKRAKKHKEKHANKKAKKKERKEKKRRSSGGSNSNETEDAVEKDFRDTFDRIKDKYAKCDCRKSSLNEPCCCKSNFPTPEEVYCAMKSEMRNQLAEIKRKVKEGERKLDAINSKDQRLQRESTPSSSKSSSSSKLSFTSVPTFSPSILSSSSSVECNQSSAIEFSSNGKVHSDTESCSSTSSKRKAVSTACEPIDFQVKKSKSLVGYIFASKKRLNESKFDSSNQSATDDGSLNSDVSATLKRNNTRIKQEIYDFDENVSHPEVKLFGSFSDEIRNKNHLSSAINDNGKLHKLKPSALSKPHKKVKGDKERKQHRRSSEHRERKRRIDNRCLLTTQHLDNLTESKMQRVLTAMGGLFYAGCLTAVRAPDLYGVTLDGERGNKAHIMSREDILRDAVRSIYFFSKGNSILNEIKSFLCCFSLDLGSCTKFS